MPSASGERRELAEQRPQVSPVERRAGVGQEPELVGDGQPDAHFAQVDGRHTHPLPVLAYVRHALGGVHARSPAESRPRKQRSHDARVTPG